MQKTCKNCNHSFEIDENEEHRLIQKARIGEAMLNGETWGCQQFGMVSNDELINAKQELEDFYKCPKCGKSARD
ncbi:hypothetical protein H6503_04680 [Candidatus Woesearchaeota archaeon]|nr:hypothetical protein [Candidatus Woesearchaeota archaeon]